VPPRKRLLFVDDEPGIRNTLPEILRRYGFKVSVAGTVAEALELIRRHDFDLLLCDLNIDREGDGYEVVRAMREVNPSCVVIVLTGYPGLETAIEGIRLSIDDYIVKPAKADTLVAQLAERLAARPKKTRVLTISYYEPLLQTWKMLLRSLGYEVDSATALEDALKCCEEGAFDVLLLGSSIPLSDKLKMIQAFRRHSGAPVVSVPFKEGDENDGADFHVEPDPEALLKIVAEIVRRKTLQAPKS
jgi:DNA-binding response OmpR family regulator